MSGAGSRRKRSVLVVWVVRVATVLTILVLCWLGLQGLIAAGFTRDEIANAVTAIALSVSFGILAMISWRRTVEWVEVRRRMTAVPLGTAFAVMSVSVAVSLSMMLVALDLQDGGERWAVLLAVLSSGAALATGVTALRALAKVGLDQEKRRKLETYETLAHGDNVAGRVTARMEHVRRSGPFQDTAAVTHLIGGLEVDLDELLRLELKFAALGMRAEASKYRALRGQVREHLVRVG